jgi:hypothetical protein
MTTRNDIKNLMAFMGMAFPNFKPILDGEINSVDVFFTLLGDIDIAELKTAVQACCAEPGKAFAPSAGEIRGMVTKINFQVENIPTPGEAWAAVIGSFERMPGGNMAGGGSGPVLDHPLVIEAMRQMGGYKAIDYDNQMAERAHFLRIYDEVYRRHQDRQAQLPVVSEFVDHRRLEITSEIKKLTDKWAK